MITTPFLFCLKPSQYFIAWHLLQIDVIIIFLKQRHGCKLLETEAIRNSSFSLKVFFFISKLLSQDTFPHHKNYDIYFEQ